MKPNKCSRCGLVNALEDRTCRRCAAPLTVSEALAAEAEKADPKRSLLRRLVWIFSTTIVVLFAWYLSLLGSSEHIDYDRRKIVAAAIGILRDKGFDREAFVLGNLAVYRGTDNWWNRSIGHHDAYAATNFPFEIVTLYPEFFEKTVDDTERAAILLHEAAHLFGSGEASALERTWRNKQQLGWTAEKYGPSSEAWNNTRRLTMNHVPQLFSCGPEGKSDCFQ